MAQPHTTVANIITREPVHPLSPVSPTSPSPEGERPPTTPVLARPAHSLAPRSPITLHSALLSTLRLWLLYRDEALWTFCCGVDPANLLESITLDQSQEPVDRMNEVRRRCLDFARQISEEGGKGVEERTPNQVLRAAVDELLASESPRFLLVLPDIPGSF